MAMKELRLSGGVGPGGPCCAPKCNEFWNISLDWLNMPGNSELMGPDNGPAGLLEGCQTKEKKERGIKTYIHIYVYNYMCIRIYVYIRERKSERKRAREKGRKRARERDRQTCAGMLDKVD